MIKLKKKTAYNGLPEPYKKICDYKTNEYYLLATQPDEIYIALASNSHMDVQEPRRFFKDRNYRLNFPQHLELFHANSGFLWLLHNFTQLTVAHEDDAGGVEKEKVYNMWTPEDMRDLRNAYIDGLGEETKKGNYKHMLWEFSLPYKIPNRIVKAYADEGYLYYGALTKGSYRRVHYFVRTTVNGNLMVVIVDDIGAGQELKEHLTAGVQTFVVNHEIAENILAEIDNFMEVYLESSNDAWKTAMEEMNKELKKAGKSNEY
jgi:hypothetical protein